jgi:FkbM family methyltransferase
VSLEQALGLGRRASQDLVAVARSASPGTTARYLWGVATRLPQIVRTKKLIPADASMAGATCTFHVNGTQVTVSGDVFGGARELYCRQVYFALPGFRIRQGDVVVDLGANHGLFTTLAARVASRVLAVEAQHGFGAEIRRNLERNGCAGNVDIDLAIVGGATGVLSNGEQLRRASHFQGVVVPRKPMAALLREHEIEHVDFLKIDIEGSEFDLFRSADEWLPRVSKIVMEMHSAFGDPRELVAVLRASGMHVQALTPDLRPAQAALGADGYLYASREAG